MARHSFIAPLDYMSLLDDWALSGASLFERERLLVHPGVPDRMGFVWSKLPLLTNDFEVIFHFRAIGEKDTEKIALDQALAFWYVYENMSDSFNETTAIRADTWKGGALEQGFNLIGSKGQFNGFGAVLSWADVNNNPFPVVSSVTNDGSRTLAYGKDVPTSSSTKTEFRNTPTPAQIKIRVKPDAIEGFSKQSPSDSWNECFKIDRTTDPVKPGGYIGFTAQSGSPPEGGASDLVSIVEVDVNNFDENSVGEDMKDVTSKIHDAYKDMLTDEGRHFKDQKAQKDQLEKLTTMLSDHLHATKPVEMKLFEQLEMLEMRMDRLGADCQTLTKEVQVLMANGGKGQPGPEDLHRKTVEGFKNDIIGIRRHLVKASASYQHTMDTVQKNTGEVKAKVAQTKPSEVLATIQEQSNQLSRTVNSRGTQMSWMLICLLAAILAIGYLMWNRMTYYEKKHFI